jgi:hypothetical protein
MARKVINRKQLRDEATAAENRGAAAADGTAAPKKKAPTKRKSRAKEPVEIRMKLFWGVYSQKKHAEQKAEALSSGGKSPHFVQKVKEAVEE